MALRLDAEISLNAASFTRGIAQVQNSVMNTVKTYALAAVGTYALESAFAKTIETVKELVNESKRMGVTVEQLQVMRKAAASAGVEMETLAAAMEKLNVARTKALGGDTKALGSFASLGVNRGQLATLPAQEIIFGAIRDKIKSVNPQDVAGPLREVLGRGYGALVPVITKDLGEIQRHMESFGMIISTKTAYELKAFDTALAGVKNIIVSSLAPALVWFAEKLMSFFQTGVKPAQAFAGEAIGIGAEEHGGNLLKGFFQVMEDGSKAWWARHITNDKAALDVILTKYKDASKALDAANTEGAKALKAFFDFIEENSKMLPVDFSKIPDKPAKEHHAGKLESDSLISTGNFFGSLRGTIPNLEQRKVDLLREIAENTRQQSENYLDDSGD